MLRFEGVEGNISFFIGEANRWRNKILAEWALVDYTQVSDSQV